MLKHYFEVLQIQGSSDRSWSLATWLGHALTEIESRYGPRDRDWTFLGVEFGDGNPCIWFPSDRHIIIKLSRNGLDYFPTAIYEMAHECVHLLAPCRGVPAPVIEEGLATVFSEEYIEANGKADAPASPPSYADAAMQVRELLMIDPGAVLKLRAVQPNFHHMTADTFEQAGLSSVPTELRESLVKPFVRG
jgi:hypothetical protein